MKKPLSYMHPATHILQYMHVSTYVLDVHGSYMDFGGLPCMLHDSNMHVRHILWIKKLHHISGKVSGKVAVDANIENKGLKLHPGEVMYATTTTMHSIDTKYPINGKRELLTNKI